MVLGMIVRLSTTLPLSLFRTYQDICWTKYSWPGFATMTLSHVWRKVIHQRNSVSQTYFSFQIFCSLVVCSAWALIRFRQLWSVLRMTTCTYCQWFLFWLKGCCVLNIVKIYRSGLNWRFCVDIPFHQL